MDLKNKINELDYCPCGEAKLLYDEFIKLPFYDDGEAILRLVMCLVYEKQHNEAIGLACDYINIAEDDCDCLPGIYLFCGISYDMLCNHKKAISAYEKFLQYNQFGARYDQFSFWTCEEFIEYLIENSYSPENVKKFEFPVYKAPFEFKLQKQLAVVKTPHFDIYYYPNSTAEKEIDIIKTHRETAYQKISEYLGFNEDLRTTLYLFEDGNTKKEITGHTGAGWAFGRTMVEIYNEQCKLDPYHELVHIIVGHVYGNGISAMNEGLAVYLCNLLNDMPAIDEISDAYAEKVKEFHRNGDLFDLKTLLSLNIGSNESKPLISYRQAASFVEYTIKKLTKSGFLTLYTSLNNENIESVIDKTESAYRQSIEDIEKDWLCYALSNY